MASFYFLKAQMNASHFLHNQKEKKNSLEICMTERVGHEGVGGLKEALR